MNFPLAAAICHSRVLACFLALSLAAPASADGDLRSRLQELERKLLDVKDLSADFEEQKFSTLLRKPIVSRGVVKVAGDASRWDTIDPRPTTMAITSQEVKIYLPHSQTLEIYPVREYLQPMVLSPIPRLATIEKTFAIEPGEPSSTALNIVLKPRQKQLAEFVSEVRVEIDVDTGFAHRVEMRGADGDRTVLIFTNVRFNTGLSEADVAFVPPPETKIVRPLSRGAEAKGGDAGRTSDR